MKNDPDAAARQRRRRARQRAERRGEAPPQWATLREVSTRAPKHATRPAQAVPAGVSAPPADIPPRPPNGPGRPPESAQDVATRYADLQSFVAPAPTLYQLGVMARRRLAEPDVPASVVARGTRDLIIMRAASHQEDADVAWPIIERTMLACVAVSMYETPPASWDKLIAAYRAIWERGGKLPDCAGAGIPRLADRLDTMRDELATVVRKHVHRSRRDAAAAEIAAALEKAGLGAP